MPEPRLHVESPPAIADFVREQLRPALASVAALGGAALSVEAGPAPAGGVPTLDIPLQYRGVAAGRIRCEGAAPGSAAARAAQAAAAFLEHALDREHAVGDLATAMVASYEELNLLYTLLPRIATRTAPEEIGDLLVEQTARILNCRRVSLLVLDETKQHLRVLASRGLPPEARHTIIPVERSVAGQALLEDLVCVDDIRKQPQMSSLSRGTYASVAFRAVRVPLRAAGDAVGILTVTDRVGDEEFSTRDCMLLEGLSSVGASALLNCQLHSAMRAQMVHTIRALASAVDAKDQYTHDHSGRVARLCVATGRRLGLAEGEPIRELELAGLLHDIGKIGIPDAILGKTGRLTPAEFNIMRAHPEIGARIVSHVPGLERVAQAVLHHHERWDGTGYPCGLVGERIPLGSRIIAVADAFDSLTTVRPYRESISGAAALSELERSGGIHFDPAVVVGFRQAVDRAAGREGILAEAPLSM